MFTFTVSEMSLSEGRLILWRSQQDTGSEKINFVMLLLFIQFYLIFI